MPGRVAARESHNDRYCRRDAYFSSFFSTRIKCGGPTYIVPGPLIAQFVDTEVRFHAKQIRLHLSFLPWLDTRNFSSWTRRIELTRTLIKCGWPNYIAPGPLIVQFVDTEAQFHAKQITSHLSFLPWLDSRNFFSLRGHRGSSPRGPN